MSSYKNTIISSESRGAVISLAASLVFLFLSLFSNFCLASHSIVSIDDSINVEHHQSAQVYINSGTTVVGREGFYNAEIINHNGTKQPTLNKQTKQLPIREAKEKKIAVKKAAVSSPDLAKLSKYISDHSLQKNSLSGGLITILGQNQNPTKKYFSIKPISVYAVDNTCVYYTKTRPGFKTMKKGQVFCSFYPNRGPPVLI